MAKKTVLAIGIDPSFADFSAFSHLTPETAASGLRAADIDPQLRPQNLSQDDYVRMAEALEQQIKGQKMTDREWEEEE